LPVLGSRLQLALSMTKIIKIDLHTHPIKALKEQMGIKGIGDINKNVAGAIVKAVKSAGLDGIAITEHNNFNHSWVASLEILDNFRRENLVILPGVELDYDGQQFLRIYVPAHYRRRIPFFKGREWFLILAHPGYCHPLEPDQPSRVHYDAVEEKSRHGDFPPAAQISQARGIPVTRSSDAQKLEEIGLYYNELESR
jgi:histidinol phosphatase-like PHP family hydrolase